AAAGGAVSGTASFVGAIALNQISNSVLAETADFAMVMALGMVSLVAADDARIESLAGDVSGAGTVAVGAALATNSLTNNQIEAFIDDSHVTLTARRVR